MSFSKDLFNMGFSKKQKKESITPHKIAVAILIREFCLLKECGKQISAKFSVVKQGLIKPVHRRDFCIMVLKLIQGPDLTLPELRDMLTNGTYVIEQRFLHEFEATLKNVYNVGVTHLLDLAEYISRLTIDLQFNGIWCQINKNSILGCYLRRLMISFEKLTFSQVTQLYEAYKVYYNPTDQQVELKIRYYGHSIIGGRECEVLGDSTPAGNWYIDANLWSRRQAELFIATQAALLQSDEQSAHSPIELNQKIRSLLQSNPDLAEAHFLSYLNYLRVKEFCGAIDSLYHSFDRNTPVIDGKNNTFEEKSKGFRYAALNLAILHAQFGHEEEALAALKESIMMAQSANDNVCLQHALTWMYKLNLPNKKVLIEHSVSKSVEMNLTYITSLGIQNYTQHAGFSGGDPKHIFENMIKSDVLNCQLSYRDLMANSYEQKAALWLLFGKTEMSFLWSQLLLYLNTDNLTLGRPFLGEGMCQAMCNVANNLLMQGEYHLSQVVLKLARNTFPSEPISNNWTLCEYIHTFTRSLYNDEWSTAEHAAKQMASIDKWESCLRLTEVNYTRGDYKSALACLDYIMVDNVQKIPDCDLAVNIRIRAMILLAQIHCASVVDGNVPTSVVTILNSAMTLADSYHQDYLASTIRLHLANVQLMLGMPSQALKILDKELVQILTHGGLYDRARAMLLFVKCLVADAGCNPNVDRYKVLLEATELLKNVKQHFFSVEAYSRVRDVLYLQAQLYNELQHYEDRNNCAFEYRKFMDDYPVKNSRTLLNSL